jgi:protein farnesyltransferase/geranylgeranyltransferase type-1 subunit alpha
MDIFRAAYLSNEISERSLRLTQRALKLNAANYTAWFFRRKCLMKLRSKSDLWKELDFLNSISGENPKNYQIWYHRRRIVEELNDPSKELSYTAKILREADGKNYHAWSHRQWVIKTFKLWKGEMEFTQELLSDDIRNNSAWNQRWYVLSETRNLAEDKEICESEIQFALKSLDTVVGNESAYAYLRAIVSASKNGKFSDFPTIESVVSKLLETKTGSECAPLLALQVDILLEKGKTSQASSLCDLLSTKIDTIRAKYWAFYKKTKCSGDVLPPKPAV